MKKKLLCMLPLLVTLSVAAVMLLTLLPPSVTVSASTGYISVGRSVNQNLSAPAEIPGYYYLSTYAGVGTRANPYQPTIATYNDLINSKTGYSSIDLRPNSNQPSGYCMVFTDVLVSDTADVKLLSSSKDSDINLSALSLLKTVTGASDITASKLSDVAFQLLATPNKRANICNPIRPEQDGKIRIYLGNQIYGDPPEKTGHTTITESFNKGDSTTLGPDLSWTEPDGTTWAVSANQASCSGSTEQIAYTTSAMATVNHYSQVVLKALTKSSGNVAAYIVARADAAALASSNHYTLTAANASALEYRLEKMVAGAYTLLGTNSQDPAVNDILYLSVSGNSLIGKVNGSALSSLSITDTSLISGSYTGIGYYSTAAGNSAAVDSFEASELYTAGFPYIVNFSVGSQNSDATTHVLALPSSISAGDLLLALFSVDGQPTATINGGWSTLGYDRNSTTVTGYIFYKVATGSDSANVTTTASEQSTHIIYKIKGASGAVYGASSNGSSTNSDPPNLDAGSSQKYLWIETRSGDSTVQATVASTNYLGLIIRTASGTSGASSAAARRENETQTENPGTFTSATEQWVSWTIAIAPTVTDTVNYSASQADYGFGVIQPGSTNNTTADWILFTNSSSVSTNISVRMLASTWGSGGSGWTHSDSAAGANTAAMKAASGNNSTWGTAVFIKYNTAYNEIAQSVAAGSNYVSGLSLLAPTSFTDGYSNNNTVRFNFYAASP